MCKCSETRHVTMVLFQFTCCLWRTIGATSETFEFWFTGILTLISDLRFSETEEKYVRRAKSQTFNLETNCYFLSSEFWFSNQNFDFFFFFFFNSEKKILVGKLQRNKLKVLREWSQTSVNKSNNSVNKNRFSSAVRIKET